MKRFSLLLITLTVMRIADAQVACPVSSAVDFWTGPISTGGFLFSTYSSSVVIDGTLEVNTSVFTFDGADVGFKSAASKIVVNPSCTLRIINGSTLTNLDVSNRWQGIEVLAGGRLEVNGSEICGAVTAIHCNSTSSTGAEFDVRNSFLRYNITGMLVGAYTAGQYPGIVHNTHFQGGTLPSMTPSTSFQGIYASSVDPVVGSGLVIGETTATSTPNRFTDMDYGIRVMNTTLEVISCEFEDIQEISGSGTGYAVHATEGNPGSFYLGVGFFWGVPMGSALIGNTMKDCLHGVYVSGYDTVRINNNKMSAPTDSFRTGITVERVSFSISVLNNEIQQFGKLGILLNDNPGLGGGPLVGAVSDNRIRGENLKTKGIFVDEFFGGLTMKQDTIDRVWRGIGIQSSQGAFNLRDNVVDFRYPGAGVTTEPAAGIYVISSDEALLLRNIITGNCPSPAGGGPCDAYTVADSRIRGIQLNQTFNTKVYNNNIQYTGAGVYVQGPNFEGNMVCNDFFDNYTAVLWDNLPTDGFGVTDGGTFSNRVYGLTSATAWSENTFVSSVAPPPPFRSWSINGADAGSVDWFYQSAPTYDFPGGTIGLITLTALSPTVGVSTNVCSLLRLAGDSDTILSQQNSSEPENQEVLDAMIRSQLLALNEEDFYHQLVAWHHMELSSPVLDSLLYMTSIRELDQAQSMWLTGDLDALDGLMAGVNPINSLESLMKQVWEIKVGTARAALSSSISLSAPPQILFSIENLEQLSAIALDTLSGHTQARYMAQSILNWSILDDRWVLAEAQEKITSLSSIEQRVKVYPNPTQGFLTIQSEDGIIAIKVYSMVGDLVHQVNGIANLSMTFDLGHLPKGGYTLQILHPDSKSSTVKVLLP